MCSQKLLSAVRVRITERRSQMGKIKVSLFFLTKLFSTQTFGKQDMHRYNNQTSIRIFKNDSLHCYIISLNYFS